MDSKEVIRLISSYATFCETSKNPTVEKYVTWAYEKQIANSAAVADEDATHRMLAYLLQRLGRIGRFFGKRTMLELDLNSIEEFTIINTIFNNPEIGKKELYKACVIETSTGTQIVKRLIASGFVKEIENKDDKRITNLKLTTKGTALRHKCFETMLTDVQFKFANLSKQEKMVLLQIFQKLNQRWTDKFLEMDV